QFSCAAQNSSSRQHSLRAQSMHSDGSPAGSHTEPGDVSDELGYGRSEPRSSSAVHPPPSESESERPRMHHRALPLMVGKLDHPNARPTGLQDSMRGIALARASRPRPAPNGTASEPPEV